MAMTIRLISTIRFVGSQATNTIGYIRAPEAARAILTFPAEQATEDETLRGV